MDRTRAGEERFRPFRPVARGPQVWAWIFEGSGLRFLRPSRPVGPAQARLSFSGKIYFFFAEEEVKLVAMVNFENHFYFFLIFLFYFIN